MIAVARAARWTAIAIAAAAILDPAVPFPSRRRPAVRVIGAPGDPLASVTRRLRAAGFALDGTKDEAVTVLVGDAPGAIDVAPGPSHVVPVWVLDTTPSSPNVRIVEATAPAVRLAEQAMDVRVTVEARGLEGKTSEIVLEDAGIAVASARHVWKHDAERWQAALPYLPPAATGGQLHVRAVELPGETSAADNTAEIAVPPVRGPIRTLVVEAGVTWPALFARRAVEGEPAFAVAALQRLSTRIATRAGEPPAALTRDALLPFEVALVGAPDHLTPSELAALEWFVESRGGVAVLVPDRPPDGRYPELFDAPGFEARTSNGPVSLGEGFLATEWLVARRPPAGSRTLAATTAGEPVVFSARRGAGAVIFSGALDAWRYRAQAATTGTPAPGDGFARFWRRVIADEALTVPPVLEVSVEPSLVGPGASVRVTARLRAPELPEGAEPFVVDAVAARAVSPGARVDVPIRLWPTAEPGVYQGDWRPGSPGDFDITVTAGARRGDATLVVSATAPRESIADPDALALVARVSGGRVFPADRPDDLVDAMGQTFPALASVRNTRVMRSPWWVVPFAGLLCVEWAVRRRNGLP